MTLPRMARRMVLKRIRMIFTEARQNQPATDAAAARKVTCAAVKTHLRRCDGQPRAGGATRGTTHMKENRQPLHLPIPTKSWIQATATKITLGPRMKPT